MLYLVSGQIANIRGPRARVGAHDLLEGTDPPKPRWEPKLRLAFQRTHEAEAQGHLGMLQAARATSQHTEATSFLSLTIRGSERTSLPTGHLDARDNKMIYKPSRWSVALKRARDPPQEASMQQLMHRHGSPKRWALRPTTESNPPKAGCKRLGSRFHNEMGPPCTKGSSKPTKLPIEGELSRSSHPKPTRLQLGGILNQRMHV